MRAEAVCLVNNAPWYRKRATKGLEKVGYHIVHPSIAAIEGFGASLVKLLDVIKEKLDGKCIYDLRESDYRTNYATIIQSDEFAEAFFCIISHAKLTTFSSLSQIENSDEDYNSKSKINCIKRNFSSIFFHFLSLLFS